MEWLREILLSHLESETEKAPFAVLAWAIWCCRNDLVFNKVRKTAEEVMEFMQTYLQQFEANHMESISSTRQTGEVWQAPQAGVYKINTNGSTNQATTKSGLGVVIRDSNGLL